MLSYEKKCSFPIFSANEVGEVTMIRSYSAGLFEELDEFAETREIELRLGGTVYKYQLDINDIECKTLREKIMNFYGKGIKVPHTFIANLSVKHSKDGYAKTITILLFQDSASIVCIDYQETIKLRVFEDFVDYMKNHF